MKSNTILEDFYKAIGFNVKNHEYAANWGFFMLQGLFIGIALNDAWRILQLPGENTPVVIGNQAQSIEVDFVYQLAIASIVVLAQAFGLKYGSGYGAGIALGALIANTSESGKTVSMLPFTLDRKQ